MNLFSMPHFEIYSFFLKISVLEFLINADGTLRTLQMALQFDHFLDRTF